MQRLKRVLKWWPALLVLILVAGGVVFVPKWRSTSASETSDLTQVFTVQRGNLVAAITPTGEVYAPRQVDLSFDVYKIELIELNVTAGQKVKAGDVLARIDSTALERAVTQAEADLTVAQDNLEKAQNPYTVLDLTQAKVAVAQAEVALNEAKDNLEKAQDPYTELDLTQAKLAVAQAEVALAEAKDNLEKAQDPYTELDLTQAKVAVAQAEADLEDAKENQKTLLNPDLEAAQAAVRDAETALESAKSQLVVAQNNPDNAAKLRTLEAEADWYRNNYWEAQQKFEKGKISQQKLNQEYSNMLAAEERLTSARAQAESSLASAQNKVTQAEETLQDAQKNLAELKGPDALELTKAETKVTQAEYNLAKAKENLAEIEAGSDPSEVTKAETQVTQAEYDLAKAKENLAEIEAGSDPSEVTKAEAQVSQAEYNLAKAQDTLAEIEAGPDPKEIEVAQAKVISTQAALEEAQAALKAATMVAPFDGTVISVGAEKGDLVSSGTIVVTLADLSNLRVRAIVDETDISKVEIGQQVEITFDAFPGLSFLGQVLEVPLQGTLSQNVLTYEVPVSLEGAEGVALKTGMTANLNIVVGRRENALLVPAMAVQQSEEGNVVMVQDTPQGTAVATPVEVGLSDGTYVEIVSGLIEGDRVLVEYQATQQQFPGFGGGGAGIISGAGREMRVEIGP
jgi:HlyD family secretion protein